MTALYIICGIAAFLLFVLFSSARVKIKFDEDIRVKVGFWFLRFTVYPKKEKTDKKKLKKTSDKKQEKEPNYISQMIKRDGIIEMVDFFIDTVKDLIGKINSLVGHIHIDKLFLVIGVGDDDAASAAIKCGVINSVLYPFLGYLASKTKFYKNDVTVHPMYDGESYIKLEIKARIRLIHLLKEAFAIFARLIKKYMKKLQPSVNNTNKDGALK